MEASIIKKLTAAGVLVLTFPLGHTLFAQQAQRITGTWQGVLKVSGIELRIVFKIKQTDGGSLTATMDSPDQGATDIPTSGVSFENGKLRIEVAAVAGLYEGTVDAKTGEISGQWQQGGRSLALVLKRSTEAGAKQAPADRPKVSPKDRKKITGIWQGVLKISSVELRIVFNINAADDGSLTTTMDSPDQGATDIPVGVVSFANDSLRLEMKGIGGVYEGILKSDGKTIEGQWQQAGGAWPLPLNRTDRRVELKRPQQPAKPYPYREDDVEYDNKRAGVKLAGTLTLPKSGGPFPAVILITGSGPQNKNGFKLMAGTILPQDGSDAVVTHITPGKLFVNLAVQADATVLSGKTFTVEAGNTVTFDNNKKLTVNGTLDVNGTTANPVTFTASGTSWSGLYFASGSSGTLSHCTIDKLSGGWGSGAITISNSSPSFTDCTIDVLPGSYVYGVSASGSGSSPITSIFYQSTIRSASGPALFASGSRWQQPDTHAFPLTETPRHRGFFLRVPCGFVR